jgi:hypothetical protein
MRPRIDFLVNLDSFGQSMSLDLDPAARLGLYQDTLTNIQVELEKTPVPLNVLTRMKEFLTLWVYRTEVDPVIFWSSSDTDDRPDPKPTIEVQAREYGIMCSFDVINSDLTVSMYDRSSHHETTYRFPTLTPDCQNLAIDLISHHIRARPYDVTR